MEASMKIRFIEPANEPYRRSVFNYFVYDKYIRTPSHGLMTLAAVVNRTEPDVLMYSESISYIKWEDVLDADIIFISIFTFNANRGYELADYIRKHSKACVVIGGLHAALCYEEASEHCDYVMVGEGDELIVKFLDAFRNHAPVNFEGIAYRKNGGLIFTGNIEPAKNIDTIPARHLVYNYKKMAGHSTLWPQVHASRGCPHNCAYCALVAAFGRCVRKRSPENIVADIKEAIAFHHEGHKRLADILWLTDDNFFADRKWAVSVLEAIIDADIKYNFVVQARYEVGFDDEMLCLLKKAGFVEIAMGIEFLEDEAFEENNKKCTYDEIVRSVKNIKVHGIAVRGLFIVGADNHTKGVGKKIADFVIEHGICGVLVQSMYFIPGTQAYETHKDKLIHKDWSKYTGNVVHYPELISPADLQNEIIIASKTIYSFKRLIGAIFKLRGIERVLFCGEFFWQWDVRKKLRKEMRVLSNKKKEL